MRLLTRIIVFFALAGGVLPQSSVTFCDLVRDPKKYNGKEVIVRATYRYGFEWSQLYCLDCLDKGKAWLSFSDLDEASESSIRRFPKSGIINLTVRGVFASGHTYGHLNGYRYQIVADRISDVKVIQKGMKSREEEEKAEKHWACGGIDPK